MVLSLMGGAKAVGANPFVHQLFGSNMVLQRDASDPIWGWATAGKTVTVQVFDNNSALVQTKTATAGADGRWQVSVGPFGLVDNNAPYSMTIASAGQTTVSCTNVLIGDVYYCSGQSNMQYGLTTINVYNLANEIADAANYSKVRCFAVPTVPAATPQSTLVSGSWAVTGTSTVGNMSATAYFTAREIYKQQGIPIGIVVDAYFGTYIQAWEDPVTMAADCDFTQAIFDQNGLVPDQYYISGLYNGMVAPVAAAGPLCIKAAIWDQGESNSGAEQYTRLLPALLNNWRTIFAQPNLPILIVQMGNIDAHAGIRDAQLNYTKGDPNSILITSFDTAEGLLHPRDKQDVGLRAARAAAALVYGQSVVNGQNVVGQGPTFDTATLSGSTIRCSFTHTGGGLMVGLKTTGSTGPLTPVQPVAGGTLSGFVVAGSNGTFYPAQARIDSQTNTVVVSSTSVPNPLYVQYAWTATAGGNLYGAITDSNNNVVDGMPASPFRNNPLYRFSVNSGVINSGSITGTYPLGATITVTGSTLAGQTFDHWSGDTSFLSGTTNISVTGTVSQVYESVLANYRVTSSPTNFAATQPQTGQVSLSWDAMQSVHYKIKRSSVSGGPYTTIASNLSGTTTYQNSVAANNRYFYVICAFNPMGDGPDSAEVMVNVPAVITNFSGTSGAALASLSWSPVNSPASTYNIKRSTVKGGPYSTIATGLSLPAYADQSVVCGTPYYYVASVVNTYGEGPNSAEISILPTFLPAPMQDSNIGATAAPGGAYATGSNSFTLAAAGAGLNLSGSDLCNFAYTPITGDCVITAHVASVSGSGSNPSVGVMMRASLSSTDSYASVCNSATQSVFQGRLPNYSSLNASLYSWIQIRRVSGSCSGWLSADGVSWFQQGAPVNVGLASGSLYAGLFVASGSSFVTETAVFDNVSISEGAWGASTPVVFQSPAAPGGTETAYVSGSSQAVLSWNAAVGAMSYNIRRSTVNGGPYGTIISGSNLVSSSVAAPPIATTYYYVVTAVNAAGESVNSAQMIIDRTPPVVVVPAKLVVVAPADSGAVVNFTTTAADDVNGSLPTTNTPASGSAFPVGTTNVTVTASDAAGNVGTGTFALRVLAPELDEDGDGMTNLAEDSAGTDPLDPNSRLAITQIALNDQDVIVSFTSMPGKFYQLQKSTSLAPGSSFSTIQDNIAGTGLIITGTDSGGAGLPRAFYRVVHQP